jgi:hypothetical protein
MHSFSLPADWVKFKVTPQGPCAYYNWKDKVFTISPVMDAYQFVTVTVSTASYLRDNY